MAARFILPLLAAELVWAQQIEAPTTEIYTASRRREGNGISQVTKRIEKLMTKPWVDWQQDEWHEEQHLNNDERWETKGVGSGKDNQGGILKPTYGWNYRTNDAETNHTEIEEQKDVAMLLLNMFSKQDTENAGQEHEAALNAATMSAEASPSARKLYNQLKDEIQHVKGGTDEFVQYDLGTQQIFERRQGMAHDYMEDLRYMDAATISTIMRTNKNELGKIEGEVTEAEKYIMDRKISLTNAVKRFGANGEKRIAEMKVKFEKEQGLLQQKMDRVKGRHAKNIKKVDALLKEYEDTYTRTAEMVASIPTVLDQKFSELEQRTETEKEERKTAIFEEDAHAVEGIQATKETIAEIAAQLRENFGDLKDTNERIVDQNLFDIFGDANKYEEEAGFVTAEMRNSAEDETKRLNRVALGIEGTTSRTASQLAKSYALEEAFPRQASEKITKLRSASADAFGEIHEYRNAMGKDLQTELLESATGIEQKERTTIMDENAEAMKKQKDSIALTSKRVSDSLKPVLKAVTAGTREIKAAETEAHASAKRVEELKRKVAFLTGDVKRIDDSMPDRMKKNDKKFKERATKTGEAADRKIDEYTKAVEVAEQDAVKEAEGAERDLNGEFTKNRDTFQRHVTSQLDKDETQMDAVKKLATDMVKKLTNKNADTVKSVERVVTQYVPETEQDVKDFLGDAKTEIEDINSVVSRTDETVNEKVKDNMNQYKAGVDKGLAAIGEVVNPLETDATKRVAEGKITLGNAMLATKSAQANAMNADKILLEKVQTLNDGNVDAAKKVDEYIGDEIDKVHEGLDKKKDEVQEGLVKEQVALGHTEMDLDNQMTAASNAVKKNTEASQKSLTDYFQSTVGNTNKEVASMAEEIRKSVEKLSPGLLADGQSLGVKSTNTMKNILKEAESKAAMYKATLGQNVADLDRETRAQEKQQIVDNNALTKSMEAKERSVDKASESALKDATREYEGEMKDASKEANGLAVKAKGKVQKAEAAAGAAVDTFASQTEGEVKSVEKGVESYEKEVQLTRKTETEKNAELNVKFNAIEKKGHAQNKQFASTMADAGAELAKIAGADQTQIAGLLNHLTSVQDEVSGKVAVQTAADDALVKQLVQEAKTHSQEGDDQIRATQAKVYDYSKSLDGLGREADRILDNSEMVLGKFGEGLRKKSVDFRSKVDTNALDRQTDTENFKDMTEHNSKSLETAMGVMTDLQSKVIATVNHKIGTLELEDARMARHLAQTEGVAKFQDDSAIAALHDRLRDAISQEEIIFGKRKDIEDKGTQFRSAVVEQFMQLGEELDLSEMEQAKESAMEKWAVQQQMTHLQSVLGEEIKDLSAHSKSLLADLAASSAREIQELMADASLSDEERAHKLAEIKNRAKLAAHAILEADGKLKLDQATSARTLQIATDEVGTAMAKIAKLEDAAGSPSRSIGAMMDRINQVLNDANAHLTAHQAAAQASLAQLPSHMQDAMAEAEERTRKMLDEDSHLSSRMSNLEHNYMT